MDPRRRFRFLKELSEGAFGKVYMAEMITGDNFRSIVAIKLLHGKWLGHEEIVQRSRDEARVLGLLHHRNIIRVEDLTSINGQCAVVMEFLDGVDVKTLVNYCKERGERVPFKVAFEIIAAVASALEAAYNQAPLQGGSPLHLIHRDIKPSNVMVTKAGDVKVLDFGTAQAKFDEREAHTQALAFGSAAYMAPERLLGDPDAPSGDVFSLGVTLYEMLAQEGYGKVHIRPEKYQASLDSRIEKLDLGTLGPEREVQVRQVLRLMLAYENDDRPTARQVVDLMEALADEVHDGSMRRFAREVVAPCRAELEPQPNPDDPLTGSTLFEDRTSGGRSLADLADSGDSPLQDGEPEDQTWVEDGPRTPFQVPPELAAEDTPPELIDDQFDEDLGPPASLPAGGAPTMAPPDDLGLATGGGPGDPFVGLDSIAGAPSVGEQQPAPHNLAAPAEPEAPEAPEPVEPVAVASLGAPQLDLPPEPGLRGAPEPAPPPPVAKAAVPRTVAPQPPPPAKSGGGGKLVVALVALVVIGVVLVGGGFFAASSMGLLGGDPATEDPDGTTQAGSTGGDQGVPGGTIEVGALDGTNATLSLALLPPGSATVSISSVTGFKQDWDGTGRLELVGLPPGTYKTKVAPASGSAVRGTLEVQPGKTCSYVFQTNQDGAEWTGDGCN